MQIVDVCYVICINESFEIKESKEAVYWLQHDERIASISSYSVIFNNFKLNKKVVGMFEKK